VSAKLKPLSVKMLNEVSVILLTAELGDFGASLKACGRAETVVGDMRAEIERMDSVEINLKT
jgi:hypothetical protein